MFTRYKGVQVPQNYSGSRFAQDMEYQTEMKTHKPSPSYSSTRTSVSPTFQSALNSRYEEEKNRKTSNYVYETEENSYDNKETNIQDDKSQVLPYSSEDENENFKHQGKDEESKKGVTSLIEDFKAFFNSLTSTINSEDLLLLGLIILLAGEGTEETRGAILPLALLFLYN